MSIKEKANTIWANRKGIAQIVIDDFKASPTKYLAGGLSLVVTGKLFDIADTLEDIEQWSEYTALCALDEHLGTDYISKQ
tara:strand:- start:711 stop:950 length:240 start_codon:yes stop_codon:yes gene_type:complete